MPWTRWSYTTYCRHCTEPVAVGEPAFQGKHVERFCVRCAKRILALEPPQDLAPFTPVPTPVVETTVASEFSRFNRRRVADRVRQPLLDARQRQAGRDA